MKIHTQKSLLIILLTACFTILPFCVKKPVKQREFTDPYAENYKYYPQNDQGEWNYQVITYNATSGKTDTITENAKYKADSARMYTYRNGVLWSYQNWVNSGNKLICCNNTVLVDYNFLNCTSDSIKIYNTTSGSTEIEIYQKCKQETYTALKPYSIIKCIKTTQINTDNTGGRLFIVNYFGYQIGLVCRQETKYDKNGKIQYSVKSQLVSHKFN